MSLVPPLPREFSAGPRLVPDPLPPRTAPGRGGGEPAAQRSSFRFGRCTLNPMRRELTRDGKLQPIPPKVYSLLLLLLEHRERAMSRDELNAELWPGNVLSDSVLPRTVMKARRAIGDTAEEPQWIRSIHGFGYRFVGDVVTDVATAPLARPEAALVPGAAGHRIGVLPFANETGDGQLDWVQIGLMSLATHALAQDGRLAPVSIAAMLEALPAMPTRMPAPALARVAFDALELDHVAHASLRRDGGATRLDYLVFDRGGGTHSGSIRHNDPLVLGEQVAKDISAALRPGKNPSRQVSRDPFVNELFSRAIELFRQDDGAAAAPLFALVCNMEPGEIDALQWHVRCRAVMRDPGALQLAEALVARAEGVEDVRTRAMSHVFLVLALGPDYRDETQARRQAHMDAAFRLAAGHEHETWFGMLLFHLGVHSALCGQTEQAIRLCKRAEAVCRSSGELHHLSIVQQNLALIEIGAGDLANARERLGIVLRRHRRLHREKSVAHALGWLAMANAGLGMLDVAFEQCDEMLTLLGSLRHPGWEGASLSAAIAVYFERVSLAHLERVLAAFNSIADKYHPLVHGPWLLAQAGVASARGELLSSRRLLHAAIEAGMFSLGAPFVRPCLATAVRLEVALGDFAALAEHQKMFDARPTSVSVPELAAALGHSRAAERMHHGDTEAAMRLVAELIATTPPGREQAFAYLDAAWLHMERGELEPAARLLAGQHIWCQQHPVGLATQARLYFAQGQHAAAAATQALALRQFLAARPPAWHVAAQRSYAAAAAGAPPSLPRLPKLISDTWWAEGE